MPCWAGTVCVAFCVDAFSRRILRWKASMSRHTSLVPDAVEQALRQRGYRPNGRGFGTPLGRGQYTSTAFTERLAQAGSPRPAVSPMRMTTPSPSPPSVCSGPS
ncbi:hypothetical protein GUY61_00875 [Streptomyces sp. GC420]|nr:hypothetical protein [Streptomyces sp. GC420]